MGSKGEINTYNLFDKDFFSPIQLSFLIWLQRQWNQDYLNTTSHFTFIIYFIRHRDHSSSPYWLCKKCRAKMTIKSQLINQQKLNHQIFRQSISQTFLSPAFLIWFVAFLPFILLKMFVFCTKHAIWMPTMSIFHHIQIFYGLSHWLINRKTNRQISC